VTEPSISVPDRASGGQPGGRPSAIVDHRRSGSVWSSLSDVGGEGTAVPTADAGEGSPSGPRPREDRFINRELSWLDFGARLLDLASDDRLPLLERIKFLSIFSEGLDEFFQVRVAGLEDQVAAGLRTRSPDGMSPRQQLLAITGRAHELVGRQGRIFSDQVVPALEADGVVMSDWHMLDDADRVYLDEVFNRQIFPILTPLAVDQGHPFPYISDLSLNLVVRVVNPVDGEERIARVKVPPFLSRFVVMPDQKRFLPVEQVIAAHLDSIFPAMTITEHHAFRLTRNADLSVEEDEAANLLAAVELELHRRRFGQAVRLEVSGAISTDLLDMLIAEVDIPEDNVYLFDVPIDLGGLRALAELDRPDLQAAPWTPVTPPQLAGGADIFSILATRDVLVHHPYESFAGSVEAFVALAAEDPEVLAIKQTLYRTGDNSPVVAALVRASQAGKEVTAVVEIQARFDEKVNIGWARTLEEAGVQVHYGLVTLKTHSKISLVVRREGDEIRRYCHLGSGNYNSRTARTYEDVGLFTADPDIGADAGELFNMLTGSGESPIFRRLLVSPISTRAMLLAAISEETEAGPAGRIILKTNGLTDPAIIDALYQASQAGVRVDLIVRGRCCLRPGVPGLSETITVRSLVGRYLEHSRIFSFGGVAHRPVRISFGSPDLMERNLDRRVEAIVPVDDPEIQLRLSELLEAALRDQANSWTLNSDGSWNKVAALDGGGGLGFSFQDLCQKQALESHRPRIGATPAVPSGQTATPTPGSMAAAKTLGGARWAEPESEPGTSTDGETSTSPMTTTSMSPTGTGPTAGRRRWLPAWMRRRR
jgi:polyphosphate kinase